jgi:hypothetical protein
MDRVIICHLTLSLFCPLLRRCHACHNDIVLITSADTPEAKTAAYKAYIAHEKTHGDPARVQLICERFIAESPLSTEAWLLLTDHQVHTSRQSRCA